MNSYITGLKIKNAFQGGIAAISQGEGSKIVEIGFNNGGHSSNGGGWWDYIKNFLNGAVDALIGTTGATGKNMMEHPEENYSLGAHITAGEFCRCAVLTCNASEDRNGDCLFNCFDDKNFFTGETNTINAKAFKINIEDGALFSQLTPAQKSQIIRHHLNICSANNNYNKYPAQCNT